MTIHDNKLPSQSELRAIEIRAHQLRADVLRQGLLAMVSFVKSAFARVGQFFGPRQHA
jgi:hypothetical protein